MCRKEIMNKRFIVLMTTLVFSVIFSISSFAYDVEINGIYYNLISKGNIAEVTNGDNKYEGDIKIPSSINVNEVEYTVKSIGYGSFNSCYELISVTIPNSVTRIGDYAFSDCSDLSSVIIPNSVTSIGSDAFFDCSALASIIIPNSVTNIGNSTFYGCSSLTSITIPNSVKSIEDCVFQNCSSLISVIIPNSVTSIGSGAFFDCSALASIIIPNSVTIIRNYAFYGCSNLTSIIIPNSVTEINSKAFANCSNLENIYCYAENLFYIGDDIFKDSYIEYATLHIPSSSLSYYQTTEPWSGFGTIKTLEGDGINNVSMRDINIQSSGGFINIYGLNNNEKVSFYDIGGKSLGYTIAINGTTSFAAQSGSIVIVKIGRKSIKIVAQ